MNILHRTINSNMVQTRAFPEVWWTFKTFISKLHNLFPSQSIFNLKAPRWAPSSLLSGAKRNVSQNVRL